MNFLKKFKKKKCLMCKKRVGDTSPILKYKYQQDGIDKMGEAFICNKCANKFEKLDSEDRSSEPF